MRIDFLVRMAHSDGFINVKCRTLEEAREKAKEENEWWVKYWRTKGCGPRPVIEIWELVETAEGKVKGVDR